MFLVCFFSSVKQLVDISLFLQLSIFFINCCPFIHQVMEVYFQNFWFRKVLEVGLRDWRQFVALAFDYCKFGCCA